VPRTVSCGYLQQVRDGLDVCRVVGNLCEIVERYEPAKHPSGSFDAFDESLVQNALGARNGNFARRSPHDYLAEQRVIEGCHDIASYEAEIYSHPGPAWKTEG